VRPLVIAPANVEPHAVGRQPLGRGVERGDIALGDAAELGIAQVPVLVVPARAKIRQSICKMKPASTTALYSVRIAAASAST